MTIVHGNQISLEALIERVGLSLASDMGRLPPETERAISLRPEVALDVIQAIENESPRLDKQREKILLLLLDESLAQIRYGVDRQDEKAKSLLPLIEKALSHVLAKISLETQSVLHQVIFDSKLPLNIKVEHSIHAITADAPSLDIVPQLPQLLDRLRRENVFKTVFELCELILPQIQGMSPPMQLALIAEMAHSKKAIAHELSVLMLLHPKSMIRQRVAEVLYQLRDTRLFTPVDLRRLITIRNWLPASEKETLDHIIAYLRKNGLQPVRCVTMQLSQLVGSSMDGAGAALILMETKQKSQRQIAGFLVKQGVGIREPWVMHKAPKHYFDNMLKEYRMPVKPVSRTYVNKLVKHFLLETVSRGEVPEPAFIEIAELFGADDWQPNPLAWESEMEKLHAAYSDQCSDGLLQASLQRSGRWHLREEIADSWFEAGDVAAQVMVEATDKHQQDPSQSLESIATDMLMKRCLEKWKMIFLITCLWMRSQKSHELSFDLFVVLKCLDSDMPTSNIPLLRQIAAQTIATIIRREMAFSSPLSN